MENSKQQESKIIVFAGAGASAGLGMPTTPEFVEVLRQHWRQLSPLLEQYRKYREDIGEPKKVNEPIDAEELRDWLMYLGQASEYAEYLLKHQPFDTKVSHSSTTSQFVKVVLTSFDTLVRQTYGEVNPERAYRHYSPFLSMLLKHNIDLIPLFTTNYDLVFECMQDYRGINWHIETGMEKTGRRVILNTKLFEKVASNPPEILLFKLHGSTNWWMNTDNDQIERVALDYTLPQNYKDLLIYPTRGKFDQVNQKPFSFFYNKLDRYLSSEKLSLCIAIGYSFRDKFVNEKFSAAIKRGLRLLILDKDKGMNKAQLQKAFGESDIKNKVRIEHIEFGNWSGQPREKVAQVLSEELGGDN